MPRIARVVVPGFPHHITQKGNYGQTVFLDDNDRSKYLHWIQEYSEKHGVLFLVYCIMSNHVHFIGIPEQNDSFAKTFNTAHMRYSQYCNKKKNKVGHLWQGRFYSYVLDEPHLLAAAKYIERNPIRAKLVSKPWEWKWSSARYRIGKGGVGIIKMGDLFKYIEMKPSSWKDYIDNLDKESDIKDVEKHLIDGRPFAEESFIKKIEEKLNRKLVPLPRGRPRKKK